MGLIFAVLLMTGQLSAMPSHPDGNDLSFLAASEEFVRDAALPRRLADVLSPSEAALISGLGDPYQHRREAATVILRVRGWAVARALIWGNWCPNPEISNRCVGLLARLTCPQCRGTGTGWCPQCAAYYQVYFACYCPLCRGRERL